MTWAETGACQVSTVGEEEKCAFTCMVSVVNDGMLRPFQAVYKGLSVASQPAASAPYQAECRDIGMLLQHLGTDTYWANQNTMRNLVNDIIQSYFDCRTPNLVYHCHKSAYARLTPGLCTIQKSFIFG